MTIFGSVPASTIVRVVSNIVSIVSIDNPFEVFLHHWSYSVRLGSSLIQPVGKTHCVKCQLSLNGGCPFRTTFVADDVYLIQTRDISYFVVT